MPAHGFGRWIRRIALSLVVFLVPSAAIGQYEGWVGVQVVLRQADVPLKIGREVVAKGRPAHAYRVDKVQGRWLWVAETEPIWSKDVDAITGLKGWIDASLVVPIAGAEESFDREIQIKPSAFAHTMRALIRFSREDKGSIVDARKAVELDPKSAQAHYILSLTLGALGKRADSLSELDKALDLDPNHLDALLTRAETRVDRQKFSEAIEDLNKAIRLEPRGVEGYLLRGCISMQTQHARQAIEDLTKAIRIDSESAQAYGLRAGALTMEKQFDKAIADFSHVLNSPIDPKTKAKTLVLRAQAWMGKDDFKKAIGDLNESIKLNQDDTSAFSSRADAWLELGEFDRAIADYTEVIRIDPRDAENLVALGTAWEDRGEFVKAITYFDAAIRLGRRDAAVYVFRAGCWTHLNQLDKALADATAAVRREPRLSMAHQALGNVLIFKGEVDKAFDEWNKAIDLDPSDSVAWMCRGTGWLTLGVIKEAGADLDKAIQLDPENGSAFNNRGMSRWLFGDHAGAIEDEKEATRLEPRGPDPWSNLALILATSSDPKLRDGPKAVEAAKKACELTNWKAARSMAILAGAFAEIGKFEVAIRWQEKAIAITHDPEVKVGYETKLKLYREHKPWRIEVGRRIEGTPGILAQVTIFQ